jgi:hypothetical protein
MFFPMLLLAHVFNTLASLLSNPTLGLFADVIPAQDHLSPANCHTVQFRSSVQE